MYELEAWQDQWSHLKLKGYWFKNKLFDPKARQILGISISIMLELVLY